MLPQSSRTILALAPTADWSWDRETQSRILAKLDFILVTIENAFRDKKKGPPAKPEEQWQPKAVKKAKEELQKKRLKPYTDEEFEQMKAYWKARNSKVKFIEDDDGKGN